MRNEVNRNRKAVVTLVQRTSSYFLRKMISFSVKKALFDLISLRLILICAPYRSCSNVEMTSRHAYNLGKCGLRCRSPFRSLKCQANSAIVQQVSKSHCANPITLRKIANGMFITRRIQITSSLSNQGQTQQEREREQQIQSDWIEMALFVRNFLTDNQRGPEIRVFGWVSKKRSFLLSVEEQMQKKNRKHMKIFHLYQNMQQGKVVILDFSRKNYPNSIT